MHKQSRCQLHADLPRKTLARAGHHIARRDRCKTLPVGLRPPSRGGEAYGDSNMSVYAGQEGYSALSDRPHHFGRVDQESTNTVPLGCSPRRLTNRKNCERSIPAIRAAAARFPTFFASTLIT